MLSLQSQKAEKGVEYKNRRNEWGQKLENSNKYGTY